MTLASAKRSVFPSPDVACSAMTPSGGLLVRLPGLDSPDSIALVGRNRLSQALELEEQSDNRYLRLSLYLLGGFALIFFPWAALTPITQVMQASGEVVPAGEVNVIQHLEGGIVAQVNVKDGDEVRENQVMLKLRPNLVDSEYDATERQLYNLSLQQKQLDAAIRGQRSFPHTPGIQANAKVDSAQINLLNSRLDNRADQLAAAEAVVQEKRAEVTGLNNQIRHITEQRQMWASLVDSGAASKLQLSNSDAKLAELYGARNEAAKAMKQAQANLRGVKSGAVFEQNSQIAAFANEAAIVAENIKKIRDQKDRTVIRSPVNGVVSDLRFKAPGGVVGPGAVVLSVVPIGTKMVVEVRVPSADIGFVKVSQPVDVKLQPFDSSIYGSIPGKVVSIAGTSVQDPDDRLYYYRARVELTRQFVDAANRRYPIQPGMPLIADIKGQQRSLLSYILKPFTRTLDSALREKP